ncbi:hypothetical protein ABZ490_46240 [Streptomyces sp. NPDC005811]|uniref:hypothetical protein n=1 Tax=Streptomyces sp. NPDC005811 TaxID=3154565 RepID=UPI0033CE7CE3
MCLIGGMGCVGFLRDLVCLQADWYRTCDVLGASRPAEVTVLRRRLYALSVRLGRHPCWSGEAVAMSVARSELRRRGRVLERAW